MPIYWSLTKRAKGYEKNTRVQISSKKNYLHLKLNIPKAQSDPVTSHY